MSESDAGRARRRWPRVALGVAGLAALGLLAHHVGPARILEALEGVWPWLPALLAVEGARLAVEAEVTRGLHARMGAPPPRREVFRAQLLAYWVFALFHDALDLSAAQAVTVGLTFHGTQLVWVVASAAASLVWGGPEGRGTPG